MSQILPHGRKRSATLITAAGLQMVVVQTKQNAALRWLPLCDPAQLARHVEITDVVPCTPGLIEKWADELASLIHERCGNNRIIIDRLDGDARAALESRGIEVGFGQDVIEQARRIKTVDEQKAQAHSALVCETELSMMHEQTRPAPLRTSFGPRLCMSTLHWRVITSKPVLWSREPRQTPGYRKPAQRTA